LLSYIDTRMSFSTERGQTMNTADYLLEAGSDQQAALITGRARCTYNDVRGVSARMVTELQNLGVGFGDRVGILGNNSLFWVASYLASFKIGAVAVPFAMTLTVEEFGAMVRFAGCKVVCVDRRTHHRYASAFPETCTPIFEDAIEGPGKQTWPAAALVDERRDAALMFTSGTTARPRAVRVTHKNIQANTDSIIQYLELTRDDRIMAILPFYYCFGTSLLHTHLRVGGSVAMSNTFVYPETVLDMMEATQCTGFAGVPSNYQTLLRNSTFPRRGLKSLHKVQQAGGKLQDILIKELIVAVPYGQVYVMYGQTEATARLSYLPPALLDTKLGSIGRGIPNTTLEVIGEAGEPVKPGEIGEIYAWGENICPGYWNDPEATAEKFVDGALRTTDLATVDEEGYIYVVDRKSDFIKSYGFRVSSQQIESCILELPEVVSAAVIGEPDLVRGEAIKAFVVLRAKSCLTSETIIAHCVHRLARHMVPSEVVFIDALPLNANGKVMKTELRKIGSCAG